MRVSTRSASVSAAKRVLRRNGYAGTSGHWFGDEKRRAPAPGQAKGKYCFISLGCPKNLVDSERMLGMLQLDGYELVASPEGADFAIVNTCGFIEAARTESFAAIDEMLAMKERGDLRGVIVSGCLAERQQQSLLEERPGIDHLVGVFGREEVTKVADRLLGGLQEQRLIFKPAPARPLNDQGRFRITPKHFAYLENQRRVRSALHLLRDSQDARQARHQAD